MTRLHHPNRGGSLVPLLVLASLVMVSPSGAGEIHEAAVAGDVAKVRALLDADPSLLESRDDMGNTPLISACFTPPGVRPRADVARLPMGRGADVNAKNNWGGTALYLATEDADLLRNLLEKGAEVNVKAFVGITPLHQAAMGGHIEGAKVLIEHGANLNARSSDGTALHQIINLSHLLSDRRDANAEMAKLLVESGLELQEFALGNTELHLAALKGHAHLVPLLVQHGADVNARNDFGHTALHYAAQHGYRSVADALITLGANASDAAEANYGPPPQLTAPLSEGEAHLWPLRGPAPCTGYAVKTRSHLLIFDPPRPDESLEAGLANGNLNPQELAGQKAIVLLTRPRHPHVAPTLSALARALPGADLVLGFEPKADELGDGVAPAYRLAAAHETVILDGVRIDPIPALLRTFVGRANGMGYLVRCDGIKVFHSGTHGATGERSQLEAYRRQIDYLKPFGPIDFAILPVTGRHLTVAYEPFLYLVDQLAPAAVYLGGDELASGEPRKCREVLGARDVPVEYPEGGLALGRRFHFPVRPRSR